MFGLERQDLLSSLIVSFASLDCFEQMFGSESNRCFLAGVFCFFH